MQKLKGKQNRGWLKLSTQDDRGETHGQEKSFRRILKSKRQDSITQECDT